jgi:hypothetical protein
VRVFQSFGAAEVKDLSSYEKGVVDYEYICDSDSMVSRKTKH